MNVQQHNEDPIAVSVREASRLLGIGNTKTYELLKTKQLISRKLGRRTLVNRLSVVRLMEANDKLLSKKGAK